MGNGMNKVLPGLYVGNYRDSKDQQQLDRFQITHIVAIHDSPKRLLPDKHYLCVMAADTPDQNLSQYFSVCNDFIHAARLRDGNVLIHCLAGMSRSVTVAVAYIMTVTSLNWKEALKVVRAGRAVANPNLGFQNQLQDFEMFKLPEERRRLRERFPSSALEQTDKDKCIAALHNYKELLLNKNICEGNCSRGEKCPTGVCNTDPTKGLFRRRPSSSSTRSRLKPPQSTAQSLPASPKHVNQRRTFEDQLIPEDKEADPPPSSIGIQYSQQAQAAGTSRTSNASLQLQLQQQLQQQQQQSQTQSQRNSNCNYSSSKNNGTNSSSTHHQQLHRSASGLSIRPRSSPAGLHSYTGSVPTVHGSRLELDRFDKGSAIYLGCQPPKIGSSMSLSSRGSSGGSAPPTPVHTPPASPRHGVKRSSSMVKKSR